MLRYRDDPTSTGMMIGAIVIFVASLGFLFLFPKPMAPTRAQIVTAQNKEKDAMEKSNKITSDDRAYLDAKTWTGTDQEVSPSILASATELAKNRGLTWVALRPQRIDDKVSPVQLPYTNVVEGPFGAVVQYLHDLESPNNKIAVSSIMISSADPASDKVSATIALVAYLNPPKAAAPATGAKGTKHA